MLYPRRSPFASSAPCLRAHCTRGRGPFLAPLAFARMLLRDIRRLAWESAQLLVSRKRVVLGAMAVAIAAGVTLVAPNDLDWLTAIREAHSNRAKGTLDEMARSLSHWGDFLGFNLLLLTGLTVVSRMRKSRFFRHLVVVSLLGASFSGLGANIGRATFGRARPSADVKPGFYGPTLRARLHSFPSGHTATAFGASVPIAVAFPPVGVPLVVIAGSVAWSRLHNNQHHPSDVMASICLSLLFGIPLGLAVRRRRAVRSRAVRLHHQDLHPTGPRDVDAGETLGLPASEPSL